MIVLNDCITHYLNGEKYILKKNSLLLIHPNDKHYFTAEGNGSFLNIAFGAKIFFLINELLNIGDYSMRIIPQEITDDISDRIRTISTSLSSESEISVNLKRIIVNIFTLFMSDTDHNNYPV